MTTRRFVGRGEAKKDAFVCLLSTKDGWLLEFEVFSERTTLQIALSEADFTRLLKTRNVWLAEETVPAFSEEGYEVLPDGR